jgi:hypothetical protein
MDAGGLENHPSAESPVPPQTGDFDTTGMRTIPRTVEGQVSCTRSRPHARLNKAQPLK